MAITLSDEQHSLREAVRDLILRRFDREALRDYVDNNGNYDADLWKTMATELGLHGVFVDEEFGGAGGSLVDLAVVLEETGAALLCSPFFATVALAAPVIAGSRDGAAKSRLLGAIANGDLAASLVSGLTLTAGLSEAGWTLSGSAVHVADADVADILVVMAAADHGSALFTVERTAVGLSVTRADELDPTRRLFNVELDAVAAEPIACDSIDQVLRTSRAVARVALAAEQVGAARRCLEMAVDYVKQREQFGRPIGSFQAVKHRCADMYVGVQSARAAMLHAASAFTAEPTQFEVAARGAAAIASDALYRAATNNIQLHGGIGYTWEHDSHLYLKRALSSSRMLGTPREHREMVASSIGLG